MNTPESPRPYSAQPAYAMPPQVIVAVAPKSLGLAIALSFLFGPLGLLYASVAGAVVMFFVNLVALFLTLGFGLILTWPACVIWAVIATNNYNQRLAQGYQPPLGS